MKTITQIANKARALKNKLSKVKRGDIYENFGDKECRELEEFIGFFYDYDSSIRAKIITIQMNLRSWAERYEGAPEGEK